MRAGARPLVSATLAVYCTLIKKLSYGLPSCLTIHDAHACRMQLKFNLILQNEHVAQK